MTHQIESYQVSYTPAFFTFVCISVWPGALGNVVWTTLWERSFTVLIWPLMSSPLYVTAATAHRTIRTANNNHRSMFFSAGPLECFGLTILGSLPNTKHSDEFLVVTIDHYAKRTKTIPTSEINTNTLACSFPEHRVAYYSVPSKHLNDNDPQFMWRFFMAVWSTAQMNSITTIK